MDPLLGFYLANATLLVCHEIDSAYWKEWNFFAGLFGKPPAPEGDRKGLTGFLVFHIPAVLALLYGLLEVQKGSVAGNWISLVVCGCGLFAFSIHMYGFRRGRPEFRTGISVIILVGILLSTLGQLLCTIARMG